MLRARPGHHRLSGSGQGRSAPPVPGGVGSALGLLAGTAAALLGAALDARDHPALGLALLGGTAVTIAGLTSAAGALAAAAQCWALWDGFLVNRFGELTITRASALALLVVAVVAPVVAATGRRLRAGLPEHAPPDPRRLLEPERSGEERCLTARSAGPTRRRPPSRQLRRLSHRMAHRASPDR